VEDFKSPMLKAYHRQYQELEYLIDQKTKALARDLSEIEKALGKESSKKIGL